MQTWIDFAAIKQSVGLAPILRRYHVSLRRSGRDQYRGLCPLHRGAGRDAFHVNLSRNLFHCFSCGAGGTVLDFVAANGRLYVARSRAKVGGGGAARSTVANCLSSRHPRYGYLGLPIPQKEANAGTIKTTLDKVAPY